MTSGQTRKTADEENPAAVLLGILVIVGGAGYLGYRYLRKNTDLAASVDIPTAAAVIGATLIALVTAGIVWHGARPGEPSAAEPEKWTLALPVGPATIGTASAAFAVTTGAARWLLAMPFVTAIGIALAAGIATAGLTIEPYRLRCARLQLRGTLIQALYAPLGHKQPSLQVVPQAKWDAKAAAPQTITIRAGRPMTATLPSNDDRLELDDAIGTTTTTTARRLDPATTIRRALRTHCDAHYRVSADPSALVFTATQFVPEQMDEELADLTRKARDIFESSATVTGTLADGFTIKHAIAKKLMGDFRKRVAEQNLTELVGGTWRVKWDMPASTVTFTPKPVLPFPLFTKPIPAVRTIEEAIGQYRQTRFAYGVDLDLGIQEWDPLDSPHTLVSGKTGAGKTVYLRGLIMMAALRGWAVVLVDFKGGSYSDFVGWPNVHIISSDPFESIATIHRMYMLMEDRNARARWDQSQWEHNLPYLIVVDEAAQFKVVLERLWANLKPKNGAKECPTLTELGELARLARTARMHLVVGMQRPDHTLIDTEARDNFGNRVSVGPISRIAAEMLWDDSYVGRYIPRIKGRGMSTGTHQDPRETQYYFTPAANSTVPEEAAVIEQLRPPVTLVPRYVPELPLMLDGISWNEIADAPWFALSERPDLDPTNFFRKVTSFDGDSRLGFDVAEIIREAENEGMEELMLAPRDLQPKDVVSFDDGHVGEVDGIDVADDGVVTVMWQDDNDGRLCVSSLSPTSRLAVQRSSS
ncbi:FtsK/SpoIIIE domain-containing protein [Mycobacterium sp. 050272]|uniref:FtsK/SpoIIIE domain-containing protein n=1 Tax=Mycobacterium sp. 050272 TaxID=3142488 RepID=UPI003194C4B2